MTSHSSMGMPALLLACLLLASPMSAAYAGDAKTASSSRDVWLKRAQSNADAFMTGMASWYGADFHNKKTASGEGYDMYTFTAAHRTLPIGTVVRVTDKSNGKSVMVCVTDRGPYVRGRIIDLSYAAAQQINMNDRGVGKVDLEVVSDPSGTPLQNGQAYFVRYKDDQVGPFFAFADAAAMHEALRQGHPEAEVARGRGKTFLAQDEDEAQAYGGEEEAVKKDTVRGQAAMQQGQTEQRDETESGGGNKGKHKTHDSSP